MHARFRGLFACGLSLLAVTPAAAQEQVYLFGTGASSGDSFGRSVADAGDVDLDGFPDVAVGAPFEDATGVNSGRVYVYSGRTGELIWLADGEWAGDNFGWSLDGVGDTNGDGHSEVIVGAPGHDNGGVWSANGGAVYLLSGATGYPLTTIRYNSLNAQLGYDVCGLGDITGDGLGDFATAVPWDDRDGHVDNGYVSVWDGAATTLVFSRSGDSDGDQFGYSVDGVLATGALGSSRLLVGAPRVDGPGVDRGEARLIDGFGTTVALLTGSTDNEWFGASVAGVGDTNLDGFADYAVGAPYADLIFIGADAGVAKVYSGADDLWLFSISGASAGANLGLSLAGAGDVDGDGRSDILAGAPNDSSVTATGGEARLVSGLAGLTLQSWTGGVSDNLGRSVSTAGDLNADGYADIVLGADDAPFGSGEAYVYLGGVDAPTIYCTAKVNSPGCTPRVATQGGPSASSADDVCVTAHDVINLKSGILFWGTASKSSPFLGGTLCVEAPVNRTPVQSSFGNLGPDDCSGQYSFHFSHAYMASKGIAPGTGIYAQFWSRDPAAPFNVGLTDAAAFDVVP